MTLLYETVREYLSDKHDDWYANTSTICMESIFIFKKEKMPGISPYICIDTDALIVYLYAGVFDDLLASSQYTEITLLQQVTNMIHQAASIINQL